jgi:triacylglycerol lipase
MLRQLHHVYLIPGFFGFSQFGNLKYFAHVRDLLEPAFEARGARVALHYVRTMPTAALSRRAGRLLEHLLDTAREPGPIHLVGHSSGGLDARVLMSPAGGVALGRQAEAALARVATVIGIATPHHGTPLASFFNTLAGRRVLRVLSLASALILRRGRLPLGVAVAMLGLLRKADHPEEIPKTVLDQLFEHLLADFSPTRQEEVRRFFVEAYRDQALLSQLTPEGMATVNARLRKRPGVRYGDVVLRARHPRARDAMSLGFDTYAQVLHQLYKWLHRLASGGRRPPVVPLSREAEARLTRELGEVPPPGSNDGIVPTRSQVFGEVIHACWGDHLDAVGHFDDPRHRPPHFDWLPSATGFRRHHFERLWTDVLDFLEPDARSATASPSLSG